MPADPSALPYHDTKPVGAADFYFATNATFRFIHGQFGMDGLIRYWRGLGRDYRKPVWQRWQRLGAEGVASYWQAFFAAEPGSEVAVERHGDEVRLDVKRCPAIAHLREHGRDIITEFCQHCFYINDASAREAGLTFRLRGGNGTCEQRFFPSVGDEPAQNMEEIASC